MSLRDKIPWKLAATLWLSLLAARVVSAQPEPARQPLIVAEKGIAIMDGDAAAIQRLLPPQETRPWLIRVTRAWFADPPARSCEVYLWPRVQNERLRRGEFLRGGYGPATPGAESGWGLESHRESYAQVPLPGRFFGPKGPRPGRLDSPFTVLGKAISDQDIVTVVDLVRTDHPPEDRTSHGFTRLADGPKGEVRMSFDPEIRTSIDHTLPIFSLVVTDADHAQITTRTDKRSGQGSGQQIDLTRKNGRWNIAQVGEWFA